MPIPIICLDTHLRHFAERFRHELSKPQYQHFVIVRLRLMLCEGTRTLRGLSRQVAERPSLAGLSRFFSEAPWEATVVVERWLEHFRQAMQPEVQAELQRQRQGQPKRRGRPKQPVVTGYLIGDDEGVAQAQGQEDGRTGFASLDDRRQTGAWS